MNTTGEYEITNLLRLLVTRFALSNLPLPKSVSRFAFLVDRLGVSSSSVRTDNTNFCRSCRGNALACLSNSTALMTE